MLALKQCLLDAGIAQAEVARVCGVSDALIAQWLNKEIWPRKPDRSTLMAGVLSLLAASGIAGGAELFESVSAASTAETGVSLSILSCEDVDMLLRKQMLTPEAKRAFGLFRSPFDRDLQSAEDVFSSPGIRYVREYLFQTAKNGGFLAVVGESGAGKSTLRKDLEDRILREGLPIVLIQPYVLGMEESDKKGKALRASSIMDALILTVAPNESPKQSMEAKSRQLHRVLKDSRRSGFSHCLMIEEAHALNVQTLKHLKRFIELEDGFAELLSVVLIGQTELKVKLSERSPEVREVVQRCQLVELAPLDAGLEDYLAFKFKRVGIEMGAVFGAGAMEAIRGRLIFAKSSKAAARETVSLMYPLMVNNLVVASLNLAVQLGLDKVDGDVVKEA